MAFLRILIVSILAPFAACPLASLVIFGDVEPASFLPVLFALPGSLLLLATTYGYLAEQGRPLIRRYVALAAIGLVDGALMLGFLSGGRGMMALLGGSYGLVTAVCWVTLHALARLWAHLAGHKLDLRGRQAA